jgi:hypothetical protein
MRPLDLFSATFTLALLTGHPFVSILLWTLLVIFGIGLTEVSVLFSALAGALVAVALCRVKRWNTATQFSYEDFIGTIFRTIPVSLIIHFGVPWALETYLPNGGGSREMLSFCAGLAWDWWLLTPEPFAIKTMLVTGLFVSSFVERYVFAEIYDSAGPGIGMITERRESLMIFFFSIAAVVLFTLYAAVVQKAFTTRAQRKTK